MNLLRERSNDPELMDNLECNGKVVHQTLREIDLINETLGGNSVSISGIKSLLKQKDKEVIIMDIGCGSGDLLKRFVKLGKKLNLVFRCIGIDANPYIIEHAKAHCADVPEIKLYANNIFDERYAKLTCDILHASLFLHHFDKAELIRLFGVFKQQASLGMVISDLHRHPLAYYSIKLLTSLFSRSDMVRYDAALSVKRGFKYFEWKEIFDEAGITDYSIKWKWAFRWQIIIRFDHA